MSQKFRFSANNRTIFFFFLFLAPAIGFSYQAKDFNWIPPFLAKDEKPTITIIYDSSGSMQFRAYGNGNENVQSNFNSTYEYFGYFNPRKYYSHDGNHFIESSSTSNPSSGNLWNGNFLNWLCMSRDDVAKKVLTGGDYSSASKEYSFTNINVWPSYTRTRYDDRYAKKDLLGNLNYMTPRDIHEDDKRSNADDTRIYHYGTYLHINYDNNEYGSNRYNSRLILKLQALPQTGVIDRFKDKARLALFRYDPDNQGAKIISYMAENSAEILTLKGQLNAIDPQGATPLAESLFTVSGYIAQDSSKANTYGPRYRESSYNATINAKGDPFYFSQFNTLVPCTQQTILLVTDGESTSDANIDTTTKISKAPSPFRKNLTSSTVESDYLQDVAWWSHTNDLRTDTGLDGIQNISLYTIFASFGETSGSTLLKRSTLLGSFKDKNEDGIFNTADLSESDFNNPQNYFEATNGHELESAITQAFQLATASIASGTAAAVTSQTRSGEGAVYQALFFPPTNAANRTAPDWSGQVHAFLLDARGNMREDTNNNRKLDPFEDRIIEFSNELIFAHTDLNGDSIISDSELNSTSIDHINDIKFLWSTSPWLNSLTDSLAITQRNPYSNSAPNRYIFTFVDKDNDMVADHGEVQNFELLSNPTNLNSPDYFYNYLTLYESSANSISLDLTNTAQAAINTLRNTSPSDFSTFQASLAKRQVDFIRGKDVGNQTISGIKDDVRSKTLNGTPWRLGDIIFSSPTFVGRPAENYHHIYQDKTYEAFWKKYSNRRQMVYVGANDGMLHAFNGGFYNSTQKMFSLSANGETEFPLGMEVWAYVPYNLLPHLKWLMNAEYGANLHAAYMDLKPRIFDARVFFQSDGVTPVNNSTHPNGWGTILVAGMRLGGAKIQVDINKTDGNALNATLDRSLTSAYVLMDITNPENPPTLLGELAMPGQGFTTCYPAVIPMSTRNSNTSNSNQWYLAFGSGPATNSGDPTNDILGSETSKQAGKLFVLDLKALVAEKLIKTVDNSGTLTNGSSAFATLEPNSFISDPVSVDLNIGPNETPGEFKADVIYYGSVAGNQTGGSGKLYRLETNNDNLAPFSWKTTTLIDAKSPITAAPAIAIDDENSLWIYFGTGRFFSREDIPQTAHMSFFGIKEPESDGNKTWATVSSSSLYNSTEISLDNSTCGGLNNISCVQVYKNGSIMTGPYGDGSWNNLVAEVRAAPGWRQDFTASRERVLGQAAVLGGAVLFTSYRPTNDICSFEGSSSLWALYYKTGTAYYLPIIGATGDVFSTSIDLGRGMAITPNLHVGEKSGSTAFIQSSTGAIETIELVNPISTKSGTLFWRKNTD